MVVGCALQGLSWCGLKFFCALSIGGGIGSGPGVSWSYHLGVCLGCQSFITVLLLAADESVKVFDGSSTNDEDHSNEEPVEVMEHSCPTTSRSNTNGITLLS